jgi:2',3'-cyclic-nucleotide 2'-phosphodiesterase (5'-nucleotidase family)
VYQKQQPSTALIPVNSTYTDSLTRVTIQPYKNQLDKEMNRVLGVVEENMAKEKPKYELVYWIADVMRRECEASYGMPVDMAVMNNGGVRVPVLPKGQVTVNKIFELMPFENEAQILVLPGDATRELLLSAAEGDGTILSNVSMVVRNNQPDSIFIGGKPFDINQKYKVAVSDYLATGGGNMGFLKKSLELIDLNVKIRDQLISFIEKETKAGRLIRPVSTARIRIIE